MSKAHVCAFGACRITETPVQLTVPLVELRTTPAPLHKPRFCTELHALLWTAGRLRRSLNLETPAPSRELISKLTELEDLAVEIAGMIEEEAAAR